MVPEVVVELEPELSFDEETVVCIVVEADVIRLSVADVSLIVNEVAVLVLDTVVLI